MNANIAKNKYRVDRNALDIFLEEELPLRVLSEGLFLRDSIIVVYNHIFFSISHSLNWQRFQRIVLAKFFLKKVTVLYSLKCRLLANRVYVRTYVIIVMVRYNNPAQVCTVQIIKL